MGHGRIGGRVLRARRIRHSISGGYEQRSHFLGVGFRDGMSGPFRQAANRVSGCSTKHQRHDDHCSLTTLVNPIVHDVLAPDTYATRAGTCFYSSSLMHSVAPLSAQARRELASRCERENPWNSLRRTVWGRRESSSGTWGTMSATRSSWRWQTRWSASFAGVAARSWKSAQGPARGIVTVAVQPQI